jgi:hypothetical protein
MPGFWSELLSAQSPERLLPPPHIPQPEPAEPEPAPPEPVTIEQSTSLRDYARARADLGMTDVDLTWLDARQPTIGSEVVHASANRRHWGEGGRQVQTDVGLFGVGERELRGEVRDAVREHRFDYSGTGDGILDSRAASGIGARGPSVPASAMARPNRARWR